MVAAQQFKHQLRLDKPMVRLSIGYDGKSRIDSSAHDQAVDEAYRKGYDEASAQYTEQIVEFRAEVSALRENTFSQLEQKFSAVLVEAKEALASLVFQSVARALGGFEMTQEAILATVDKVIEESGLDEEKMEVRIHPLDLKLLSGIEPQMKSQHPGLDFVEDDTLNRGDCLLNSRFGKVDGLMSTKLDKLRESLRPAE